jgi:allophanate hydrolase
VEIPGDLSLAGLRRYYREQKDSPRGLVTALQQRAAALNDEFHTYIELLSAAQLEPYFAALESQSPESLPLYGVPFAIKDNIDLVGATTTAACPDFAYTAGRSATVVARLIELGAIPTGKTNLDQFATGLNGLRSPYGECRNAVLADYPSGGSSSGSALAVALGLASFALGTDTAGSGRVPAALNGLVGLKPTRGIVSIDGVVPCCRSLDCVSVFTRQANEAAELLALIARYDESEPHSRRNPAWNITPSTARPARFRFAVPRPDDRIWCGCDESPALFERSIEALVALGGTAVEIDFRPFLDAARLLYAPAGAAERYAAFGEWLERDPPAVLPVIDAVVRVGADASAADRVRAAERLQALRHACDKALADVDCVLSPTIPRPFTSDQIREEPVQRNSELGTYTNFMNLLDYAAVAVPAGHYANGLPFGVTLFGRKFADQYLLAIAGALQGSPAAASTTLIPGDRMRIVVCGAHLNGLALNHQLLSRGGKLIEATTSAPAYKLYALPGGPPLRPAMVRDAGGRAIEVEVWEIPSSEVGSFLAGIGAPLGLGKVELVDGRYETGFVCEHSGIASATDITEFGGWRGWLSRR